MKTTAKHFEQFKGYCSKWQNTLGLKDWAIYYYHKKLEHTYAETKWTMSDSVAVISLGTLWDNGREFNQKELERLALHEVLHILTARMIAEAEARYTTQDALDEAEHALIRRLENCLLDVTYA